MPTIATQLRRARLAPLSDRDAALSLLLRLRDALYDPSAGSRLDASKDWQLLLHTLCFTILAFRGTVPMDQSQITFGGVSGKLISALVDIDNVCRPLLSAASSAPGSAPYVAAAAVAANSTGTIGAAIDPLLAALRQSTEQAMLSVIDTLVAPLLKEIELAAQRIATALRGGRPKRKKALSVDAELLPACHGIRGRAWTMLGPSSLEPPSADAPGRSLMQARDQARWHAASADEMEARVPRG